MAVPASSQASGVEPNSSPRVLEGLPAPQKHRKDARGGAVRSAARWRNVSHIRNVYHIDSNSVPVDLALTLLGDIGFVVGSALILSPRLRDPGVCVFAIGSVFCCLSAIWFGYRSFTKRDNVVAFSQACSAIGNFLFAIFSVTYFRMSWRTFSLWGFLAASAFFVICAVVLCVLCCMMMGFVVLFMVPSYTMNLIGGITFVVGSVLLLQPDTVIAGGWVYLVGSVAYLVGVCGDIIACIAAKRAWQLPEEGDEVEKLITNEDV